MRKLIKIIRWLLMVVSSFGILMLLTFLFYPSLVNSLGQKIVASYVASYQLESSAILKIENDSEQIFSLEKQLVDLQDIKKGDRLAPIKRVYLEKVSNLYFKEKNYPKAMEWALVWMSFDDKDLFANIRYISALYEQPEYRSEARAQLNKLLVKVPESAMISKLGVQYSIANTGLLDAVTIALNHVDASYPNYAQNWQIFWDTGDGFKAGQSALIYPTIHSDYAVTFDVDLPKGVKKIRLDPPPNSNYEFRQFTMNWNDRALILQNQPLKLHHMEIKTGVLRTSGGGDPYFSWTVEDAFSSVVQKVSFSFDISPALPDWTDQFVSGKLAAKARNVLAESANTELLQQLLSLQKKSVSDGLQPALSQLAMADKLEVTVYWSLEEKHFSETRRSTGQAAIKTRDRVFEIELEMNSLARRLRFDFPNSDNAVIEIMQLQLLNGNQLVDVDLVDANYKLMNNISREGRVFSLLGRDPHFAITIDELLVERLIVRGIVQ
jgi:hypothetical protein